MVGQRTSVGGAGIPCLRAGGARGVGATQKPRDRVSVAPHPIVEAPRGAGEVLTVPVLKSAKAAAQSGLSPRALAYDKPLCASLDGFTLHAATRAGALDLAGREALLRYVLRPPLAQERIEPRPDGLVRIVLKRAFGDGTAAVEMDPLSLLCRLATSVPPPRFHTVKYAGVLAPASPWRSLLLRLRTGPLRPPLS